MASEAQASDNTGDIVYSGTYTNGIVLSNPATQNPATIAVSGLATNTGTAIYGEPGTAWTVANYGTVSSVVGIDLAGGGLVVNGASGLITSTATPSVFGAVSIGGGVTYGAAGTINNSGTIKGGARIFFPSSYYSPTSSVGIALNTGTIAGATGVSITASDGTVTNYGRIAGTFSGVSITYNHL